MKAPAPEVFVPQGPGTYGRCRLCDNHPDACEWIASSLAATYKARAPRWTVLGLTRRIQALFGVSVDRSVMDRHLRKHEPNWTLWNDGPKAEVCTERTGR